MHVNAMQTILTNASELNGSLKVGKIFPILLEKFYRVGNTGNFVILSISST